MRNVPTLLTAAALLVTGCANEWPEPPPVDVDVFAAEHEEWRQRRRTSLVTPPEGPVLWIGLWDLPQGETALGSDEGLPITLPAERAPARVGVLRREGMAVTFTPEPGSPIRVRPPFGSDTGVGSTAPSGAATPADPDGTLVTEPLVLENDRSGRTTVLTIGSLAMRVHAEAGSDRLWLRAWDEELPQRQTFRLPEYYPVDPGYRVAARWAPYDEPEPLYFPDVAGGLIEYTAPGELEFEIDGRAHSLVVTEDTGAGDFFVILWDSTATTDTYQGGRYMHAGFPDDDGWTVLDFNRAYNPPCVFSDYSVCPLAPPPNRIPEFLPGGEKRKANP